MSVPAVSVASLIARTRRVLRRRFTREVALHSSRPPDLLRALYVLAEEEALQTQSSLATRLDLDAPAASRLAASLVAEGLVARETGVDRRCRTLRITSEGESVLVPARVALQKVDSDIEQVLGIRQVEVLRRLLTRVLDVCEEAETGNGAPPAGGAPQTPRD